MAVESGILRLVLLTECFSCVSILLCICRREHKSPFKVRELKAEGLLKAVFRESFIRSEDISRHLHVMFLSCPPE